MKAWRKHNQKHPKGTSFHLTRKQARTHFQAEVSEPSQLLYGMFLMVGLPTPPEFRDWFMKGLADYNARKMNERSGTSQSTAASNSPGNLLES